MNYQCVITSLAKYQLAILFSLPFHSPSYETKYLTGILIV